MFRSLRIILQSINTELELANQSALFGLSLLVGEIIPCSWEHCIETGCVKLPLLVLDLSDLVFVLLLRSLCSYGLGPVWGAHWILDLGLHAVEVDVNKLSLVLCLEVLHSLLDFLKISLCLVHWACLTSSVSVKTSW